MTDSVHVAGPLCRLDGFLRLHNEAPLCNNGGCRQKCCIPLYCPNSPGLDWTISIVEGKLGDTLLKANVELQYF